MAVTAIIDGLPTEPIATRFLWLDLTRKCQLSCTHCYNASGPNGTHGTVSRAEWISVLDQGEDCGVREVQFIGGEPTMHPDAAELVNHALALGLGVEVYSNLVHLSPTWWALLQRDGVSLATSYYSDQADEHNAMTGRPSHARTRANIERAVQLGIPPRVGIVSSDDEVIARTRRDLQTLGVTKIGVDRVRPFGRGAHNQGPNMANLCGRCGNGKAAIGPTGEVSPCVFSGWMGVGNVRSAPLAAILGGSAMAQANASLRSAVGTGRGCEPDFCHPATCNPQFCNPDDEAECTPGTPPSTCTPKR